MKQKTIPPQVVINEKLGDFFIDIAKLIFAGVVLSTLLDMDVDKQTVLSSGVLTTVIFVIAGFLFYSKKQTKNGNNIFIQWIEYFWIDYYCSSSLSRLAI